MHFKVKGILSYPHLFQPRAIQQGDEPKYSTSVLIPKDDPQIAEIQRIIELEKKNGFPNGFPASGRVFLKEAKDQPGYMVISGNAKQDSKPVVVDANMKPVMDPSQAYPGCVAWVQFNTFVYSQAVNKGVSAGLNGVMLTGEEGALGRLDGKPTADQMFADVAGSAPAPAPAPAPALVMTSAANGASYQQYKDAGWSDEQMISQGVAMKPSFA